MKDILERIEDSSHNESSHELICRLLDCADEIKRLRASSMASASTAHTESAATVAWLIDWPDEPELGHYFGEEPCLGARNRPLVLASSPAPSSVSRTPVGWKLVPINPTEEMLDQWIPDPEADPPMTLCKYSGSALREIYAAMLAASPAPSPVSGADERAAFERALKETYQMVDPFDPSPAGSYSRGVHNGIIAALKTIRENFERAATIPTPTGQQALSDAREHCMCVACRDGVIHASDCAVHNEPAMPAGTCDCGIACQDNGHGNCRYEARSAAPQAVALTDEQIDAIAKQVMPYWAEWTFSTRAFARAILAAAPTTTGHTVFGEIVALLAPFTRFNYEALDAIPFEEDWSDSREQRIYGERVAEAAMRSCDFQLRQRVAALAATPAPATADALTDAARDVLAERRRQVEQEGWTPEHDDEYSENQISMAAACYALESIAPYTGWGIDVRRTWAATGWDWLWWKPTDRRRNLIKAGALILAEIERLDRAALSRSDK